MSEQLQKLVAAYNSDAETTLPQRFNAIIDYVTSPTRRWKELEELTGIATHSWQKAYLGKQRPTSEMLEALAQHWPGYAFWLMTGITDLSALHLCPPGAHPWPSTPEELASFEEINDSSWQTQLSIKRLLAKHNDSEPLSPLEQAKLDAIWDTLSTRLRVDEALRAVLAKNKKE